MITKGVYDPEAEHRMKINRFYSKIVKVRLMVTANLSMKHHEGELGPSEVADVLQDPKVPEYNK